MSNDLSSTQVLQVSSDTIADWLHNYVAELIGVNPEKVSRTQPLRKYGLDSASAVTLTGDLAEWLKVDVDPSVLYEYPTIERAAQHLASVVQGG